MDGELGATTGGERTSRRQINGDRHDHVVVDWRGRPCDPRNHGGIRAASFLLGLQAFELMAIAAVGNNLITYLINEMHFPLSTSANIVTNFIGTIFLLSLLGGYLSDSYLGSFATILLFGFLELSGLILLSVQAHLPQLKPPRCDAADHPCTTAKGRDAVVFFVALYTVALGSGCVKPNMIAHGADQFDETHRPAKRALSTYFNAAYFAFSVGQLVALTALVYVQTHSGMDVGFAVSAAAVGVGLISLLSGAPFYINVRPRGSILTPIARVLVAAMLKRKQALPTDQKMSYWNQNKTLGSSSTFSTKTVNYEEADNHLFLTGRCRFLNKACIKTGGQEEEINSWSLCSVDQVEQVKVLISVLPIFASTIIFNTILAQLQTFSVQQGSAMNTHLTSSFRIPPASLQAIPYLILIFLVPLYDAFFVPFARNLTGHDSGISPLRRIGAGLFLASFSMVAAALVENKRRNSRQLLSIFWISPQFVIFGLSEMFTAVGLIEFFYKQSLKGMQSFLTAMTYCSYSFGFYLSSLLVSLVNKITSSTSSINGGWLGDNDLNKDRLDLFYWLLAALSLVNFLNYIFWSRWYSNNRFVLPEEEGS